MDGEMDGGSKRRILTPSRKTVPVEDAHRVTEFVLQNAAQRRQNELLLLAVPRVRNVNVVLLIV